MKARAAWHHLVPLAIMEAGHAGVSSVELAARFGAGSRDISDAISRMRRKLRKKGEESPIFTLLDIGFPARYFGTKEWRDAAGAARGPMQSHMPKHAKPKAAPVMAGPVVGAIPAAVVLPHQPVYSRHQLTALPPGWQSPLSASECRPWAATVGQR